MNCCFCLYCRGENWGFIWVRLILEIKCVIIVIGIGVLVLLVNILVLNNGGGDWDVIGFVVIIW